MPKMTGILETSLYVDDLEAVSRFYEGHLGFRRLDGDDRFRALGVADRQVLLLFKHGATTEPVLTPSGMIPSHNGRGQLHLAFSIPAAELPAWEKHLAARGIPIESRVRWPRGGESIYFRDPEQHLVELVTPGCWEIY